VRLLVTHHAFVRMGDWHPEFRQFVPTKSPLDYEQAQGVINALHVFVASLESGRPSTKTQKRMDHLAEKYQGAEHFWIFDRPLGDIYQMVVDGRGLTLVTVTALQGSHADAILDDLRPAYSFDQVDEIALPYVLGPKAISAEFLSLRTPAGREIRISYDVHHPRPKTEVRLLKEGEAR